MPNPSAPSFVLLAVAFLMASSACNSGVDGCDGCEQADDASADDPSGADADGTDEVSSGDSDDGTGDPTTTDDDTTTPTYDVMACATSTSGTLKLLYDYDSSGNLGGGTLEEQGSESWSLTEITSARYGEKAGRSELRYTDPQAYGGPRAELAVVGSASSRYTVGDEAWYGMSIRIPSGWVDDGAVEDIIFQWKGPADTSLGEADHSPDIFLGIKRDEWILRITSDAEQVTTDTSELKEQELLVDGLDYTTSPWHDFVFHMKWSNTDATGLIEVWHRLSTDAGYAKVLTKSGPNMHTDVAKSYLKWGIYKPAWRTAETNASVRVVDHDEIRAGSSFTDVEPGCAR